MSKKTGCPDYGEMRIGSTGVEQCIIRSENIDRYMRETFCMTEREVMKHNIPIQQDEHSMFVKKKYLDQLGLIKVNEFIIKWRDMELINI